MNVAVPVDRTEVVDGQSKRHIEAFLTGAVAPKIGDLVVLADGEHRIEAVERLGGPVTACAFQLVLS